MSPVFWASSAGVISASGSGLNTELAVCKLAMTWLGADPDALDNVGTITSTSKKEEVLCNVVYDTCRKAVLEDHNWQFAKRHQQLSLDDGTEDSDYNQTTNLKTITGITAADPVVVTAASHGFLNGWLVRIYDVTGMTEINGMVVRVANKAVNTFECYGLNGTNFTAYGSGGKVVRYEAVTDYQNGYVYRVPEDMLRPVSVIGNPQFEVVGAGDDRRILCTSTAPVLEYVSDFSVVADMPNHFARCWAARIAMELANPLQKKNAAIKDMAQWYSQVLNETKRSDARQADPAHLVRNTSPTLRDGGWE
jgi:hypothetical protein